MAEADLQGYRRQVLQSGVRPLRAALKRHAIARSVALLANPINHVLLAKASARLFLLLAGLVVASLDRKLGFLFFFLSPVAERIAPPRRFQVEGRELQALPDLDCVLHELALRQ